MTPSPLGLQSGTIKRIDTSKNNIYVQSTDSGGGLFEIPLDNIPGLQLMPEINNRVVFIRGGELIGQKILKIYGNEDGKLRKGDYSLEPGEVQYQGVGGSYLNLNVNGDVSLVDGSMLGSMRIDNRNKEIVLEHMNITLKTFNGISVEVKQSGSVVITNAKQNSKVSMDEDGITIDNIKSSSKIIINNEGVSIKGKVIALDGQVYIGSGASDSTQRMLFGDVVTSGPLGTHPLDFVTGIPIPGSITVKAKG